MRIRRSRGLWVCWGLVAVVVATARSGLAQDLPAIVVEKGSVARQEVVALGRDLVVAGEAMSDVVSISGSTRVEGRVGGDVIVLGGDGRLSETARVAGDVFVLGGRLEAAPGARIVITGCEELPDDPPLPPGLAIVLQQGGFVVLAKGTGALSGKQNPIA